MKACSDLFGSRCYKKKTFLRAYGELNSFQCSFGKVMVSRLQLFNHEILLTM